MPVVPWSGAPVDVNRHVAGKHDVEALHRLALCREDVPRLQLDQVAVGGEAIEEEAPVLSPEEEAGIEAALESYRQGRVVNAKRAREIIDAALGR